MDFRTFLRIVRKRRLAIGSAVLLGLLLAGAWAWTARPTYEASTQLFVAAKDTTADLSGLAQGGQFTQQRVQSYADIIDSPDIASAVAAQLGHVLDAKAIAKEVTATAPMNTVLLNVHVRDTSPRRAQAIANAVSDQFAAYASELETPPGGSVSPVKVTVVKRAQLPSSPVSPRKPLDLALGLIVGLAVGVGGALLRETLDTSIRDPEQLRRDVELPALGAIAYDPDAKRRPLIVHADRHSPRSEAFRQLRTNLQFLDVDRPVPSIVITSSIPEEGKTTTAANLAIAIAQSGTRVLLIESDLRRPKLADYLGVEGAVGLTSVLIGQADVSDAVRTWGEDGYLDVLPSGPIPPNPSELLGSRGMATLIKNLEREYDLVLVDAPPLLPVTDAAVLANVVSGALVVVRHGHTKREQLIRAVQSLRAVDAHIFGLVLTMTPTKGPDAYYYGYGYRYDHQLRNGAHTELVTPVPRIYRPSRTQSLIGELGVDDDGADEQTAPEGERSNMATRNPLVDAIRTPALVGTAIQGEPLEFFRC